MSNKSKQYKNQTRDLRQWNMNNFNETGHESEKDPGFFQNLKSKRKNLHTVRGHKPSYSQSQVQLIPRKFAAEEIEREVELEIKREELSTREGILKWLKNPRIRRLASQEFQRSGHTNRYNKFKYQIQQRKNQLKKLNETYENLKNQLKTDPLLKSKRANLKIKNCEMKDKLFEESEYTKTLMFMINRQNLILQHKSKKLQSMKSEIRFLNIKILAKKAPEISHQLYKKPEARIIPDKKFMDPLKKDLLTLRIFKKIKENAKKIVDDEEREFENQLKEQASNANHEKNQHMLKSMRDLKRRAYYMENYDNDFHRKANIDMLNDIISKEDKQEKDCPYDPMKELTSENFFVNETEMNEDTQKIKEINDKVDKEGLVSKTGHHSVGAKEFASREFVIMIKETFDELNERKEYLAYLKQKLSDHEDRDGQEKAEIYSQVVNRIYQKGIIKDSSETTSKGNQPTQIPSPENSNTLDSELPVPLNLEEKSNSQRMAWLSQTTNIPTMNDEVERVLLVTKREKDEAKQKLLQAKSLVISACGLIDKICTEIRINNKNDERCTSKNISEYMSLCGLKFEKLMRNNKLIKAQYERLVEINMQRGEDIVGMYDYQDEMKMI